jgi:hypothetical protein
VKGEAEEPALVEARHERHHPRGHIEKGCRQQDAFSCQDADDARLVDNEESAGAVICGDDLNGRVETLRHDLHIDCERRLHGALESYDTGGGCGSRNDLVRVLAARGAHQECSETCSDCNTHSKLRVDDRAHGCRRDGGATTGSRRTARAPGGSAVGARRVWADESLQMLSAWMLR